MSKQLISFAFGLSEFAPIIKRWLESDNAKKNAQIIKDLAVSVTNAKSDAETFKILSTDKDIATKFQGEVMKLVDEMEKNLQKEYHKKFIQKVVSSNNRAGSKAGTMVLCAVLGLTLCLGVLSLRRESLSGEVVGIISTIAGIFGSCLKDVYSSEFGGRDRIVSQPQNEESEIIIKKSK
ncbi:MAG: hypothetical protein LBI30_01850 [Holosporales bacterium]|jgi:hypothetical protein|nr:hypothetical protein [Holosporales bacterium]